MKKCSNCQTIVDDRATYCSRCGYSFNQKVTNPFLYGIFIISVVFLMSLVLYSLLASSIKQAIYNYYYNSESFYQTIVGGLENQPTQGAENVMETVYEEDVTESVADKDIREAAAEAVDDDYTTDDARAEKKGIYGLSRLKGSIDKYGVEMILNIEKDEASGLLHYNSQRKGINLTLKGYVGEYGQMTIYEYDPSGENTGCFDGFFDGDTYKGTFTHYSSGKTYSYTLTSVSSLLSL